MSFVKVCPTCGAEFVATVELCYDCGETLVSATADEAAAQRGEREPAEAAAAELDGLVAIETADLDWARELCERLAARGIGARLAPACEGCRPTLSVLVAPRAAATARQVARELYLEQVPDIDAAALALPAADRCPSCGGRLAEGADQCPECGLAFPAAG